MAMILITPMWFEQITNSKTLSQGILWSAFFAPILLFIHPSVLPIIGLATLYFSKRSFLATVLGSLFGGFFFYLLIHSAKQEVMDPNFIQGILHPIRSQQMSLLALWFDRLKGPFHYWFSDVFGLGKFLSPKNWFIFLAIIWTIKGKLPRKLIVILLTPFALAGISLIPLSSFDQLGLIFYHSVKRIGEITPLLGFTLAIFAASKFKIKNWQKPIFAVLSITLILLFNQKVAPSLETYHELYATPKHSKFDPMIKLINEKTGNDLLIIDRHEFDIIRFTRDSLSFTLKPECAEVGTDSEYCVNRKAWMNGLMAQKHSKRVWWIPSTENDEKALSRAKFEQKQFFELSPGCHLIQAI